MEEENLTRVFVYGTLKPGGHYHDEYCGEFLFETEKAQIQGRLFDFPHLGYPGVIEAQGQWVQGYVLSFRHPNQTVLSKLDKLEGFDPAGPIEGNEYYRKMVTYNPSNSPEITGSTVVLLHGTQESHSASGRPHIRWQLAC